MGNPLAAPPLAPSPAAMQAASQVPTPGGEPSGLPSGQDLLGSVVGANEQARQAGVQAQVPLDKALKETTAAGDSQKAAIEAQRQQDLAVAGAQSGVYQEQLAKLPEIDSKFASGMAIAQKQQAEAQDRYLRAVDDYKNTHVYNWWSQATTGGKILGVISQMLAGGLQGMTGKTGEKTPLDNIIDHDLALQRMNLTQKSDIAQQAGSLYRDLTTQLKDRPAVEAAMRDIAYNSVLQRIKAMAGAMGTGQANADAQKAIAMVEQKIAENRGTYFKASSEEKLQSGMQRAGFTEHYAGLYVNERGQDMELAGKQAAQGVPVGIVGLKGSEALPKAIGNDAFNKFKEKWDAVPVYDREVANIKSLLTGKGAKMDTADRAAALDSAIAQMKLKLGKSNDLVRISEPELKLVENLVGVSKGWKSILEDKTFGLRTGAQIVSNLEKISRNIKTDVVDQANSFNVRGVPLVVDKNAWKAPAEVE